MGEAFLTGVGGTLGIFAALLVITTVLCAALGFQLVVKATFVAIQRRRSK